MRISDVIAAYIQERLNEMGGTAELQRNLLAEELGCVPSQINYVLTARFTPEQGYIVESRRGGGGYIRVSRVRYGPASSPLIHLVEALDDTLEEGAAQRLISNLAARDVISAHDAKLLLAATSNRTYRDVEPEQRDKLRAAMMKQLLTVLSL